MNSKVNSNTELEMLNNITLSKEESNIVTFDSQKNVKLLAFAGSGKTIVMLSRIAYLIKIKNVDPSKIIFFTANDQSIKILRRKANKIIGLDNSQKIKIETLKSFCDLFLRKYIDKFNSQYKNNYFLFDEEDKKHYIQHILNDKKIDINVNEVIKFITTNKLKNIKPNFYDKSDNKLISLKAKIYSIYQDNLKNKQNLDTESLFLITQKFLKSNEEIKQKFSDEFEYVFYDNFQDISEIGFNIFSMLFQNKTTFISSDKNQLTSFDKGENLKFINKEYDKMVKNNFVTFLLTKNYRSSQKIVELINKLIVHMNNENRIHSDISNGKNVVFQNSLTSEAEAKWVIYQINQLKRNKIQLKDIAIIYRSSFYSKSFEDELKMNNINYKILDENSFYQRSEIKNCTAFLRLIYDWNDIAFLRIWNVPNHQIDINFENKIKTYADSQEKTIVNSLKLLLTKNREQLKITFEKEIFLEWNAKNTDIIKETRNLFTHIQFARNDIKEKKSISLVLSTLLKKINYFDYLKNENSEYFSDAQANINVLLNAIKEWEQLNPKGNISDYLNEISINTEISNDNQVHNYVSLMKAKSSKTKEFKYAFITGLCDNIWPTSSAIESSDPDDMQYERRLLYIALSRAQEQVFLSSSQGFVKGSLKYKKQPSRFLKEMDIDTNNADSDYDIYEAVNTNNDYIIGDIVNHEIYGEGTIINTDRDIIRIAFKGYDDYKEIKKNHKSITKG